MPDPVFQDPSSVEQSVQPDLSYQVVDDIQLPNDVQNLNMQGGPYLGWGQVTRVRADTGWAANTVGDPNNSGVIADLIRPWPGRVEKVVTGVAVRAGAEPDLPDPEPDTDNQKLAHTDMAYFSPSV